MTTDKIPRGVLIVVGGDDEGEGIPAALGQLRQMCDTSKRFDARLLYMVTGRAPYDSAYDWEIEVYDDSQPEGAVQLYAKDKDVRSDTLVSDCPSSGSRQGVEDAPMDRQPKKADPATELASYVKRMQCKAIGLDEQMEADLAVVQLSTPCERQGTGDGGQVVSTPVKALRVPSDGRRPPAGNR